MTTRSITELNPPTSGAMTGKVVLITGASSGLGYTSAAELAGAGAEIVMVCRDRARGEAARAEIAAMAANKAPTLLLADLSSQAEIHSLADDVARRFERVDVLINNAGGVFSKREMSVDGIELTLATNHLAPFLLTHLLLAQLLAAPAGRIVTVASEIYARKLDFANLQGDKRYGFLSAYKRSKLANILFSGELARRVSGSGVTVNAVSPGPARTRFGDNLTGPSALFPKVMKRMPFFATPAKACQTIVWAASSQEPARLSGRFFMHSREEPLKPIARDAELSARLWALSEELCGIDPGRSAVNVANAHAA